MNNNNNRQYLITGLSSDIGRALVCHLLKDSSNRMLTTSRSKIDSLPKELCDNYRHLNEIDLAKQIDLEKLRSATQDFFDQPFIAIHCVGDFWYHKPLDDTPLSDAHKMMESHYCTLYGLAHTIIPIFKNLGGGKLIAFSCNSVGHNYPEMSAFTSAKAALECFIKCISNEYSKYNVIANAIALSTIRTPKVELSKKLKYHEDYITIDELAEMVLETVAELSPLINGNVIRLLKYSDAFYNDGYFQRNLPRVCSINCSETKA